MALSMIANSSFPCRSQLRQQSRHVTRASGIQPQPAADQSVEGGGSVVELLVWSEAVTALHLGDERDVIPHPMQGSTDQGPVVSAQKNIRIHAVATAAAFLHHVLHVNASDVRAENFNPLLGKAGFMDITEKIGRASCR